MPPPDDAEIRRLREDEREALLALLGAWELPPPWQGRATAFFRRYVDCDPSFEARNVVVAQQEGRLVGCVQIFPRLLRVPRAGVPDAGVAEVPIGGIGSVFTRPEARSRGFASALLERARAEMTGRGLELGLLFASLHRFYGALGWVLWPRERPLWCRGEDTAAADATLRSERFDATRDLEDAFALHRAYSAAIPGTCVRDARFFRAQLDFAGNPDEDFVLVRDTAGSLAAYARGALFEGGAYCVTDVARRADAVGAAALADLVVALLQPRALLVAPCLTDPALDTALDARGVVRRRFSSRDLMLCILEPAALARRLGESRRPEDDDARWLARALPPERLTFWPADRF